MNVNNFILTNLKLSHVLEMISMHAKTIIWVRFDSVAIDVRIS